MVNCRVSTLGQPLEVVKTTMAANRSDSFGAALRRVWSRGGILGCMQSSLSQKIKPNELDGLICQFFLLQIIKVSFHGRGLRRLRRVPSYYSSLLRPNMSPKPSAQTTSLPVSRVV